MAARAELDVEVAAGDLLEAADGDPEALETARRHLDATSGHGAGEEVSRRAAEIVEAAIAVGYAGE